MQEVYLDNAATTRCNGEVAQLALMLMTEDYGNPSSLHTKGLAAQLRLEHARGQLSTALGCGKEEVIFTSGGTEANNLAVFGAVLARRRMGKTIVAMSAAHASIRSPLSLLEQNGYTVRLVAPLPDGNADTEALSAAVDSDTALLCLELVGSEVGAITPVAELCRGIRRRFPGLFIHCDAVQGLGKTAFTASRLGVDSLSVSAHKIFAPKGCGALYLKKGVRITPLLYGGSQEKKLRAGTENVPLACAFGMAAQHKQEHFQADLDYTGRLHEYFVKIAGQTPQVCINSPANATPYISNISVPGYRSETMLHHLAEKGVYVSSGSACAKGAASHVLKGMQLPASRVDSALRISFSPENTTQEIDIFFDALRQGIGTLTRSNI